MPEKLADVVKNEAVFDPQKETARARIKIIERADGGREFILPAFRNFKEKFIILAFWLIFAACLVIAVSVNKQVVNEMPSIVRFVIVNHVYFAIGILGVIELLLTIACADTWLRSSRLIATAENLQVTTHWGFVKRAITIPTAKIIEVKIVNNTTDNETRYYQIVVLATGEKPGWLAKNFPPRNSLSENELKVVNTGGRNVAVATDIKGEDEAQWLRTQLCAALKIEV